MRAKFIYEKFTEDSDPIHDMGIGLYFKKNFKDEIVLVEYIAKILPGILHKKEIPTDILKDKSKFIVPKYQKQIEDFIYKYITLHNNPYKLNPHILYNILIKRGFNPPKGYDYESIQRRIK